MEKYIQILKDLSSLKKNFIKNYNFQKLDDILKDIKIEKFPVIENLSEFQIQLILDDVKLFEIINKLFSNYHFNIKINLFSFEDNFLKFINGEVLDVNENEIFIYEIALKIYGLGFKIIWTYLKDKIDVNNFNKNYCPICGYDFEFAYIDNKKRKFLVCGLCDFAWNYPINKCPICEKEIELNLIEFNHTFKFLEACECKNCNRIHKVFFIDRLDNNSSLDDAYISTLNLF